MLNTLGLLVKVSFFAIIVLVLGNWIRWEGRTISDQVKIRMSHAERSNLFGEIRTWADQITHDAKKGVLKKFQPAQSEEEIPSSERQKLKSLIQELNSSHKND